MEEDYEEMLDEAEDEYEQGQDLQDAQVEQYESTFPQAKTESTIYTWFWRVVRLNKPFKLAKVGNLDHKEIGEHLVSVRDSMNLAHLGHLFGHSVFGNYFATRAKIVSATSMAKKGWFMDLSISQRKIRERTKKSSSNQQGWRMFKKKNQQAAEE